MKLINKMMGFAAIMVSLMCVIAFYAYYSLDQMGAALQVIGRENIPISNAVTEITTTQRSQAAWLERGLRASAMKDSAAFEQAVTEFNASINRMETRIRNARQVLTNLKNESTWSEEDLARFDRVLNDLSEIQVAYQGYQETGGELMAKVQGGAVDTAGNLVTDASQQSDDIGKLLAVLNERIAKESLAVAVNGAEIGQTAVYTMAVIGIALVLAVAATTFVITRSVLVQLGADPSELARIAENLAEGRLDLALDDQATGVHLSVNRTVLKLQEVIGGIKLAAREVSLASEQVEKGNTDLSQRTQEQASNLEEVAASMEQMTSTVNQNAENASQANQMALEASRKASEGGETVNRAVQAMREINVSSGRIADIIGVIDEIAFQTNLLALNAAVEAARAGEQGRGFAVVAGEVRNLAGRSAKAAKEIKELIGDTVTKVADGARMVDESGRKLEDIVAAVKRVSDNSAEIAAASQEQSQGISQVNKAVTQMDDATQENASLIEEAAASSETLDAQARELQQLIEFFRLPSTVMDNQPSPAAIAPRPAVRRPSPIESTFPTSRSTRGQVDSSLNDDSNWEEF